MNWNRWDRWGVRAAALGLLAGGLGAPAAWGQEECATRLTARDIEEMLAREAAGLYEPVGRGRAVTLVGVTAHVVRRSDGTGGLDDCSVARAIADANLLWEESGIQFRRLGDIDSIDDDDFYTDIETSGELDDLFTTNSVGGTINIYFAPSIFGGSACGVATFTTDTVAGVAVAEGCALNTSTLAHEIGHYFDLYHTHETGFGAECVDGSNCSTAGDLLCDTPADPDLSGEVDGSCNYTGSDLDGCNSDPYSPDTTNVMSYSNKTCRTYFSPDQSDRAYTALVTYRSDHVLGSAPEVWYVDVNVPLEGAEDGRSWCDAFSDLQDALDVAAPGDEVWVAQGWYVPGTSRYSSFRLADGVAVYGGFDATETVRSQRRPLVNVTLLSGDVDGDGTVAGNAFSVVFAQRITGAVLDGFVVQGGNAEGDGTGNEYTYAGGGMFIRGAEVLVKGCRFRNNTARLGGGAYLDDPSQGGITTNARFACCIFNNNSATGSSASGEGYGGAIASGIQGDDSAGTELVVRSCTFWGNTATSSGGAIASEGFMRIFNGVFTGNSTPGVGGGVYTGCCDTVIVNSTFASNVGALGGGGAYISHAVVANSIFWDNERNPPGTKDLAAQVGWGLANFINCDIMGLGVGGGVPGAGNFEANPAFTNAAGADGIPGNGDDRLSILSGSPCEDAGDNASVPAFLTGDRNENPRISCTGAGCTPVVDVGAYEVQKLVKGEPAGFSTCARAPGGSSGGGLHDDDGPGPGSCASCELSAFLLSYARGEPSADINRDGWVDARDVVEFLGSQR